jgi:rhodanese-related sulfurtransferase
MHLSLSDFNQWKLDNRAFLLIDIREDYEVALCTIGGKHIPLDQVVDGFHQFPKDIPLVFHCNSGKRSDALVYFLEHKFNCENVYSLEGGVQGYAEKFDSSLKCTL